MVLTITERGKTKRLGFTGDVGNPGRPILRDPQTMQDCDWLICESTYGGKEHEPAERAKERLGAVIGRTAERGGRVIIPAFSVGRTQEIVYALDQLWNEGHLRDVPVYVDSPLAVNATGVFQSHPECFDAELHEYMLTDDDPWGFDRLTYIRDVEKSKALNGNNAPMVIISASGMCEAGRILHHLRNNIGSDKNTVMMVGYCAEHTLGKRIIEKRPEVRIFGQMHKLRAEVEVMNSFSAHADEAGILDFVGKMDRDRLKRLFLVHGAPQRQDLMAGAFERAGYDQVVVPEFGESAEL
jgi:metallo-beta-lactamase family protein